ncbi:hypothetical protein MRX96_013658 [Rhipicephalus microplus]
MLPSFPRPSGRAKGAARKMWADALLGRNGANKRDQMTAGLRAAKVVTRGGPLLQAYDFGRFRTWSTAHATSH